MNYDKIIIHSYPGSASISVVANFYKAGKIVSRMAAHDVDTVLEFISRKPFCNGIPYKVITHKC